MTRPLDSDLLGDKGEEQFGQLCTDAGLIRNPSTKDRKGWDFVVDWRHRPDEGNYDTRATLPSCLVQVKTIWTGGTAISTPLLAIEHLAKDLKPAFIYVVQVNEDRSFADSYIAHLRGDLLAHVLKALRIARVKGKRPGDKDLSLSLRKWFKRIPHDYKVLRAELEGAIGLSMGDYAEAKQTELRKLGYEQGAQRVTFRTGDTTHAELVDAFFGLRPMQVCDGSATETRFGIEIPIPDLDFKEGQIQFEPRPFDTCKLLIRDGNRRPYRFDGEVFGLPTWLQKPATTQMLIKTPLFSLRFMAEDGGPQVKFRLSLRMVAEQIRSARTTAQQWSALYGFLAAATKRSVNIQMHLGKVRKGPLDGRMNIEGAGDVSRGWDWAADICKTAAILLDRVGWSDIDLAIEEIEAAGAELELIDAMLNTPRVLTPLNFTTEKFDGLTGEELHDMLYSGRITLGAHSIAFAFKTVVRPAVEGEQIRWTSDGLELIELGWLEPDDDAYDGFVERMRLKSGIQSFVAMSRAEHSTNPAPVGLDADGEAAVR